jgi:hypothetical protein
MGIEADRHVAPPHDPRGVVFWGSLVVGWGVMVYGIVGALGIAEDTHPRSLAIWIVGSLVVHDFVIAPSVFIVGGLLRRVVPARVRAGVQAAMFVSAILAVISVPVIGRFGARRDNPSLLPREAGMGLLVALAVVWIVTGVSLAVAWRRSRTATP